jgi:hypothetical protein
MIESLHAHKIERILELGAWRDEGRRFAVGLNGEVFKHEDDKEYPDERRQGQGGTSASPAASASPPASGSEPAGANGGQALRPRYAHLLKSVREFYPSLLSREVKDGLWVIVQSHPLGLGDPRFWICLFLPYSDLFDPKAFAFSKISPPLRAVGPRHTNYPDASICAYIPADDAWRPGDSPLTLLNLYAEWIVCHLYFELEQRWPGAQFGMDAIYRNVEFGAQDWCTCDSGRRYGECHMGSDRVEVEMLKLRGKYVGLGTRIVPASIEKFARSKWKRSPVGSELKLHPYEGLSARWEP